MQQFNQKLELVKEAERKMKSGKSEHLAKQKIAKEELDKVLDKEISVDLNSI